LVSSIHDIGKGNGINVYPNPAKRHVIIRMDGLKNGAEIKILNIDGKVLDERIIAPGEEKCQINFNEYSDGVYLIWLKINDQVYTKKIILSRDSGQNFSVDEFSIISFLM
jgi:hypothetical protein